MRTFRGSEGDGGPGGGAARTDTVAERTTSHHGDRTDPTAPPALPPAPRRRASDRATPTQRSVLALDAPGTRLRRPHPIAAASATRLTPLVTALRWLLLVVGLAVALTQGRQFTPAVLAATLLVLADTTLRTISPIPLDSQGVRADAGLLLDAGACVAASAISGGWQSPYLLTIIAVVLFAGFSRGYLESLIVAVLATALLALSILVAHGLRQAFEGLAQPMLLFATTAVTASYCRKLFIEVETRHEQVLDEMARMTAANDLLLALHGIAQTLPASLDLGDVLSSTRTRIRHLFDITTLAILVSDEITGKWRAELSEGVRLPATLTNVDLPAVVAAAGSSHRVTVVRDLLEFNRSGWSPLARSALYAPLRARDRLVGIVALEHTAPGRFSDRDAELLQGLADPLALAIDNAIWFARLRTLGAEAERARIARDLHDRLAQSLAYVSFELERLVDRSDDQGESGELESLRDVVRSVLGELRETLYTLRTAVSEASDLEHVTRELVDRFRIRTGIDVTFTSEANGARVPVLVEQELWRILQEAATNIERHSRADHASLSWKVSGGWARLEIRDDGVGFHPEGVPRERFGLVGMRERADAIGAHLTIDSEPGCGTRVLVELEVPV